MTKEQKLKVVEEMLKEIGKSFVVFKHIETKIGDDAIAIYFDIPIECGVIGSYIATTNLMNGQFFIGELHRNKKKINELTELTDKEIKEIHALFDEMIDIYYNGV